MQIPETRYVQRRGGGLAYQAFGSGSRAFVMIQEVACHLDLLWTDPIWIDYTRRLAQHGRVLNFQQMGVGLSDRIDRVPTLEEHTADIAAVMDAEGIERATFYGLYSTAMPILLLAAQQPARAEGLVLWCPVAQGLRHSPPEELAGYTPDEARATLEAWDDVFGHWGQGRTMDVWDPVIADAGRSTMAMLERTSASPATAAAVYEAASTSDVRDVLGLIRCPVRVLRHPSFTLPEASVRLVAERIPNASYHVLPSSQPYMGLLEPARPAVEHLLDLSSGGGTTPEFDRELATLLFTDVVGSTELLERMGDAAWSDVRRRHEHDIRSAVEAAGGALVDVAGDGSFSLLGGPAAAIRCAREISERAAPLGLTIRSGVHFGECQRNGGGVTGLAVHIAARVGAAARPGEIWVSRTVRDVVGGSGIRLRSRGVHELKGVPEPWELYAVADDDDDVSVPAEPPRVRPTDRALVTMARRAPRVMRAVARLDGARRRRAAGVRVAG